MEEDALTPAPAVKSFSPNRNPPGPAETESSLTLSKPLPSSGSYYFSSAKPK